VAIAWTGGAAVHCLPGLYRALPLWRGGRQRVPVWQVDADGADCLLHPTPARRTVEVCFEGKPVLDELRAAVAQQGVAGAFIRVRWTMAEEDRHEVDRAAILQLLTGAAEVKLEGRIVPVVRTRAAGIAQAHSLAEKVRAWAEVTACRPEPLLTCLEALLSESAEAVAAGVLGRPEPNPSAADARPSTGPVGSASEAGVAVLIGSMDPLRKQIYRCPCAGDESLPACEGASRITP
jgi:hypothetical protein